MDEKKKDYKTARAAASIVILVIAVLLWRLCDMGFAIFIAAGTVFAIRSFQKKADSEAARTESQEPQPKITISDEKPFQEWLSKHPEAVSKDNGDNSGTYTHEEAARILAKLKEMYSLPTVRIKVSVAEKPLAPAQSKFGGFPYWTKNEDFPRDEDGKPLYLLAQINFAEVPLLPDYPARGLLQIFVRGDDLWGLNMKSEDLAQKNWRIVWREDFDETAAMTESELRSIGVKCASDENQISGEEPLPFQKEFSLAFTKTETCVNPNCDDFSDKVRSAAQALGLRVFGGGAYAALDWFAEDDYNAFCEDGAKHQIGGYPDFTQSDMRREGDLLLFQMDSEFLTDENGNQTGNEILWGDMGIANFFIRAEDLQRRDFSRVLYNWDCY